MAPFFYASEFESYLSAEKRFSEHTIVAYLNDVKQFFKSQEIKLESELKEINHHSIRSWIVDMSDQDLENKTIVRKVASLRTYFRFLLKIGAIDKNPTLKIQTPKVKKRLPHFAKEKDLDVEKIDILFPNGFAGLRDRLMFEFFYQTGIRLSELIGLKNGDVQNDSIKVLGKRNKERIIPISENLTEIINEYNSLKNNELILCDSFFILDNGKKLYPKFVYRKINYYLSMAASGDVNSPHVLRHTFATHMLNNGAGLETLKDILGHANLAATQVYTHNSFAQLTHIYSSAHPRGHKKD